MHLSLLSDVILSDLLDDSGCSGRSSCAGIARQHLDGLLRGLLFASALLVPVALTVVSTTHDHARPSPSSIEARP